MSDDAEAEAVVFELGNRGYVVVAAIEQTATGRLATDDARAALRLVSARGCARGKNLDFELDRAIRDFGPDGS